MCTLVLLLRAERIYGAPIAALKGKTKRMSSTIFKATLTPRVTQQQQILHVDLFYVKSIAFILGVLTPLNYVLTSHLQDKSEATVYKALSAFISKAKSRNFDIQIITTDRRRNQSTDTGIAISRNRSGSSRTWCSRPCCGALHSDYQGSCSLL